MTLRKRLEITFLAGCGFSVVFFVLLVLMCISGKAYEPVPFWAKLILTTGALLKLTAVSVFIIKHESIDK